MNQHDTAPKGNAIQNASTGAVAKATISAFFRLYLKYSVQLQILYFKKIHRNNRKATRMIERLKI